MKKLSNKLNKNYLFLNFCAVLISTIFTITVIFYSNMLLAKDLTSISEIKVEVIVADEVITNYDVLQRLSLVLSTSNIPVTSDNIKRFYREIRNQLVDEKLQILEAEKFNIEVEEAEITQAIEEIARSNNMNIVQMQQYFKSKKINIDNLRTQIKSQILWKKYVIYRIKPRIVILDNMIDQRIRLLQKSSKTNGWIVSLSEIVIPTDNSNYSENKAFIHNIYKILLKNPEQFSKLAKEFSHSASKSKGGKIGWVNFNKLGKHTRKEIHGLIEGGISKPIYEKSLKAFYIIKLHKKKKSEEIEFNQQTKEKVRQALFIENLNNEVNDAIIRLRKQYFIDYLK